MSTGRGQLVDFSYGFHQVQCVLTVLHWLPVLPIRDTYQRPLASRRRFTLRTLLIATTLVAVVLGLVVYATRR